MNDYIMIITKKLQNISKPLGLIIIISLSGFVDRFIFIFYKTLTLSIKYMQQKKKKKQLLTTDL